MFILKHSDWQKILNSQSERSKPAQLNLQGKCLIFKGSCPDVMQVVYHCVSSELTFNRTHWSVPDEISFSCGR